MRLSYDSTGDVLSIVLGDNGIVTKDLNEDISVVLDPDGQITQVQIHAVTARYPSQDVFRQIVLEGIGPFSKTDPLLILPRLFKSSALLDEED